MDKNFNGFITKEDLIAGVKKIYDIQLSEKDAESVISIFDSSNN